MYSALFNCCGVELNQLLLLCLLLFLKEALHHWVQIPGGKADDGMIVSISVQRKPSGLWMLD